MGSKRRADLGVFLGSKRRADLGVFLGSKRRADLGVFLLFGIKKEGWSRSVFDYYLLRCFLKIASFKFSCGTTHCEGMVILWINVLKSMQIATVQIVLLQSIQSTVMCSVSACIQYFSFLFQCSVSVLCFSFAICVLFQFSASVFCFRLLFHYCIWCLSVLMH